MRDRLAGIEGVRAVAAMMVLLYHTWVWGRSERGLGVPPLDGLLRYFYLGITIFFVLSGFLLYRPFVAAALRDAPRPRLGRYAAGRVLRIVPAFWVCLYFWSLVAFAGLPPLEEVVKNFFFIQIYWPHSTASLAYYWPNPTKTLVQPAWTLCLEVVFYVMLPVLAVLIRKWAAGAKTLDGRAGRQLVALALLFASSLVYDALSLVYPWRLPLALPTVLCLFAVGMMLAVVTEWWDAGGRARLSSRRVLALDAVAVALLVAAATVADRNVMPKPESSALRTIFFQPLVALATATVLVGMLLARKRTLLLRFCSLRATVWVGIVSYGVYLWHAQILLLMTLFLPDPSPDHPLRAVAYWLFDSIVVAAVVVLVASLSWNLVERRLLALKNRVARGGAAAQPAVAEAGAHYALRA